MPYNTVQKPLYGLFVISYEKMEDSMKKNRLFSAVLASAAALTITSVQSAAFIKTPGTPTEFVKIKEDATWLLSLDADENSPFNGCSKIQAVVEIKGDTDKYFADKAAAAEAGEDEETGFADFGGCLALNAKLSGENASNEWWIQYNYLNLDDHTSDGTDASVDKLSDTVSLITADLNGIEVDGAAGNPAVNIMEWNVKIEDYWLEVKELYVYGADGNVSLYCDGDGNIDTDGHDAFDPSAYADSTSAPAETAASETTAAPETAAAETTTTTAAATTAAANDGAAASTTAKASNPGSADFGSRDSTLLIVGIAAGVIIIGAIVGLIIFMSKKKK